MCVLRHPYTEIRRERQSERRIYKQRVTESNREIETEIETERNRGGKIERQ